MNFIKRLKEERERLGFSQSAMGDLVGSGKTTVINWEKGASAPDAVQLMTLSTHGADVYYLLTGKRSVAVAEMALLPNDERGLLDSYRRCPAAAKKTLIQTAALLAAGLPGMGDRPAIKQSAKGSGNIQIGSAGGTVNIKN